MELGEIETALRRHPNVDDAALVLLEDRLLAWFIPRGSAPTDAALRAWLADHIPLIFIPAEFRALTQFPRTITGKTNRAALLEGWLADQSGKSDAAATDITEAERRRVTEEWNQTARPYPLERSVVEFFQEQARRQPDAPALKHGEQALTYAALNRWSNRIARQLLGAGLKTEDIVVLRFERSMAFAAGALAVLKAGGSYLPLDAHTPTARQNFVLQDCQARFALMAKEFLPTLNGWTGWSLGVEKETVQPGTDNEQIPRCRQIPGGARISFTPPAQRASPREWKSSIVH